MGKTDQELLAKRNQLMARGLQQAEQIRGFGISLETNRKIDLTFWAPTEDVCKAFAEACKQNEMPPGLVLGPANSQGDQRWLVRCSVSASVSFVTTKENVATYLLFG